jgi:hypothetical protein
MAAEGGAAEVGTGWWVAVGARPGLGWPIVTLEQAGLGVC